MHKKTNYEENGENRTEISRKEKAQKKGVRGAIWFFVGCVIVSFIIVGSVKKYYNEDRYIVQYPNEEKSEVTSKLSKELNTTKSSTGAWFISDTIDPIDDSRIIYIALEASEKSIFGKAILFLRYDPERVLVGFSWDEYMGFDKYPKITIRLDSRKARTFTWLASNDVTAYLGDVTDFICTLMVCNKLVVRATKYDNTTVTRTFYLEGLENAIRPYRSLFGL